MPWIETEYRDLSALRPGDITVWGIGNDETMVIERIERPRDFSGRWLVHFADGWRTWFQDGERIAIAAAPAEPAALPAPG